MSGFCCFLLPCPEAPKSFKHLQNAKPKIGCWENIFETCLFSCFLVPPVFSIGTFSQNRVSHVPQEDLEEKRTGPIQFNEVELFSTHVRATLTIQPLGFSFMDFSLPLRTLGDVWSCLSLPKGLLKGIICVFLG